MWRLARIRFFRLCLLIFVFRRFFNEPIRCFCGSGSYFLKSVLRDDLIERKFDDTFRAQYFQVRDDLTGNRLADNGLDCDPFAIREGGDGGTAEGRENFEDGVEGAFWQG